MYLPSTRNGEPTETNDMLSTTEKENIKPQRWTLSPLFRRYVLFKGIKSRGLSWVLWGPPPSSYSFVVMLCSLSSSLLVDNVLKCKFNMTMILISIFTIEPVFLVTEFYLRYLLIFKDQILGLDFSSRCQKKISQMRFWDDSETRK